MRRPSDLDARFYISSDCFDACRAIVEDYLHLKYIQAISEARVLTDNLLPPSMIRYVYFQKQAVVGDAFSLLSIGDSSTGYNIDLEFALIGNGVRKYFDEGNACVIPLTLEQLAGVGPIFALSQTGDMNRMLDLHFRKELLVRKPEEVVNGLTLYVHALCDKGQAPADAESEDAYGESFCRAFLAQCQVLLDAGQDPLRFVLSFVRSHYALRSMLAAAAAAQMLVEISAYAPDVWDTGLGRTVCEHLAQLLSEAVTASLEDEAQAGDGLVATCWLAGFLADPRETADSDDSQRCAGSPADAGGARRRIRRLDWRGPYRCQVLGKRRQARVGRVCGDVAQHMRRCAQDAAPWQRAILATAWEVLEQAQAREAGGAGAEGGKVVIWESRMLRSGIERMMHEAGRGDLASEMLLGSAAAPRMDALDVYASARSLLDHAPAEHCGAVSGLVVKAAAAAGMASHSAAREAIKMLQQRKYACMCLQQRPRKSGALQVHAGVKAEASCSERCACGSCAALGQAMQRLLVHVVGGMSAGRRSPDAAAARVLQGAARGDSPGSAAGGPGALSAGSEPDARSSEGAKHAAPRGALDKARKRLQAPATKHSATAPLRRSRPSSPPAPPPGPSTAAPPSDAAGPPPPRQRAMQRSPSPSPTEPHGGRSPSPDAVLIGPVSPPLQARLLPVGRRGSS